MELNEQTFLTDTKIDRYDRNTNRRREKSNERISWRREESCVRVDRKQRKERNSIL